jgi:hypothetical protein
MNTKSIKLCFGMFFQVFHPRTALIMLFIALSIFHFTPAFGQKTLNISTGVGFPEGLHIKPRYEFEQTKIGIGLGSLPGSNYRSFSGDAYFHFAGLSKLSTVRPWYFRIGLSYVRDESDTEINKYTDINTRIGREFNITKHFGIAYETGLKINLVHVEILKVPKKNYGPFWNALFGALDSTFDFNSYPVFISGGFMIFYRI